MENYQFENNEMEVKLWEYIDGISDDKQRSEVEQLIAENSEWKLLYHQLLEVHKSIGLTELEQPSMRFTKNVMEEIAKLHIAPAAKNYINSKIIYGIGAFFITLIVGFLVYAVSQVNWQTSEDIKNPLGIDVNKVDYSAIFNNQFVNIFLMINVVLGLFLFDRYLNKRKAERG